MAQVFCNLTVLNTRRVSPSLHEITLGGEELAAFPAEKQGGYLKLVLEPGSEGRKALMRTYTIRRQRDDALDIQFALHGGNAAGPATSWALEARAGDPMLVRGAGDAKPFSRDADFHLIAGDMAALPAISAGLEAMDRSAKGAAILEIQHRDDAIAIDAPPGIDLQWIINEAPGTKPDLLVNALRSVERPSGAKLAGWVACEFSAMRAARGFLRDDLGLGPRELYISSYWKHGLNEIEHKVIKKEDTEAQPAA